MGLITTGLGIGAVVLIGGTIASGNGQSIIDFAKGAFEKLGSLFTGIGNSGKTTSQEFAESAERLTGDESNGKFTTVEEQKEKQENYIIDNSTKERQDKAIADSFRAAGGTDSMSMSFSEGGGMITGILKWMTSADFHERQIDSETITNMLIGNAGLTITDANGQPMPPSEAKEQIKELVDKCLDDANGDMTKACDLFTKEVSADLSTPTHEVGHYMQLKDRATMSQAVSGISTSERQNIENMKGNVIDKDKFADSITDKMINQLEIKGKDGNELTEDEKKELRKIVKGAIDKNYYDITKSNAYIGDSKIATDIMENMEKHGFYSQKIKDLYGERDAGKTSNEQNAVQTSLQDNGRVSEEVTIASNGGKAETPSGSTQQASQIDSQNIDAETR